MTLPFWYIFTSKDFKSKVTLQFSITSFVPSSKTSLDKSLWNLKFKVENLSFTMPIRYATESWASTEWTLVCLNVPNVCVLDFRTHEYFLTFHFLTFNISAWYLSHKHFLGLSEWFKAFIIFKNIGMTSWTSSSHSCWRRLMSWQMLEKIPCAL